MLKPGNFLALLSIFVVLGVGYLTPGLPGDKIILVGELVAVSVILYNLFYYKVFTKLWRLLYKIFPKLYKFLIQKLKFLSYPLARAMYFLLFLILIILNVNIIPFYFSVIFLVALYLYELNPKKANNKKNGEVELIDEFVNLDNWTVKSGDPEIENNFGNKQPDVLLKKVGATEPRGTNSFIYIKDINNIADGIVECDVYLEPGSLVNIVFRANFVKDQYYMARLDSRDSYFNSILRKDGIDKNWEEIATSNKRAESKKWHRMKVVFQNEDIKLFDGDELIVSVLDNSYQSGSVGIFNEVENVHADNFSLRKL